MAQYPIVSMAEANKKSLALIEWRTRPVSKRSVETLMRCASWRGADEIRKVIVVTSGKGGVGKTTSTAALGAALARAGNNVVVVDFDVGLRNLDLLMGAERRLVFDLINVLQGTAKLPQTSFATSGSRRCTCFPPRRPATRTRSRKMASHG
jgi:Mrp family chromosome partitioning ATPase